MLSVIVGHENRLYHREACWQACFKLSSTVMLWERIMWCGKGRSDYPGGHGQLPFPIPASQLTGLGPKLPTYTSAPLMLPLLAPSAVVPDASLTRSFALSDETHS